MLPGLGADGRLFDPQRAEFPDLVCPAWLEPARGETLVSYARRMAELVPRQRPLVLGGVSFGGMLAIEMAPVVKPDALVLIGSCQSPAEIDGKLRLASMAGPFIPTPAGERARVLGRVFIRSLGPMRREHREQLEVMIDAVPFSFIRWAGSAIFGWKGAEPPTCPFVRIHGGKDKIIPMRRDLVHELIPGAGHVPNVSHAPEVNGVLRRVIEAVGGGRG